jgi:hypothetical protein
MPSFKVGDRVERIGVLVPIWMKVGIVTKVIPNKHGIDWATQYQVDFGEMKETLYQLNCASLSPLGSASATFRYDNAIANEIALAIFSMTVRLASCSVDEF